MNGSATSWERVIEIMGDKAIGIKTMRKVGMSIPRGYVARYSVVPFSESELEEFKITGLYLVAMPEISYWYLRRAASKYFPLYKEGDDRWDKMKTHQGYCLVGSIPVGRMETDEYGSGFVSWTREIPNGYKLLSVVEVAYIWTAMLSRGYYAFNYPVGCVNPAICLVDHSHYFVGSDAVKVTIQRAWYQFRDHPEFGVAIGLYKSLVTK